MAAGERERSVRARAYKNVRFVKRPICEGIVCASSFLFSALRDAGKTRRGARKQATERGERCAAFLLCFAFALLALQKRQRGESANLRRNRPGERIVAQGPANDRVKKKNVSDGAQRAPHKCERNCNELMLVEMLPVKFQPMTTLETDETSERARLRKKHCATSTWRTGE